MDALWSTLLAVSVVSIMSLIGIVTLFLGDKRLKKVIPYLISFSAGTLLGGTFLHILPDLAEDGALTSEVGAVFLGGFLLFFLLENWFHWHHSHSDHDEEIHSVVYITQIGDTLHNFMDGMIIAASFLVDIQLGIAATVAVVLHEIPQELGNFAILVHGGWSRAKALTMNFLSALASFAGAGLVFIFQEDFSGQLTWIIAFAGANFLYLALSDIFPELQKENRRVASAMHILAMLIGMLTMGSMLFLE